MKKIEQPNVIFILSDDQGPWAMGCAGNKELKTPNLDRLANTGIMFQNFFCASPVCSPARATLMTGRMPSQHGVHDWIAAGDTIKKYEPESTGEFIEYLKDQPGYTDYLSKAGYNCGISGKWHLGDSHHAQKGFDYWAVHAKGGGNYYHAPMIKDGDVYEEPLYITDAITNNAIDWLEEQKNTDDPFYLSVHYTAPHSPWSRENHPKELYDSYYNECPFNSVPKDQSPPDWVTYKSIPVDSEETRRSHLSGYYASITAMDNNIGEITDWLEKNNLRKNTVIIFTSDNGMNMGHHGVYGKGNATSPLNMFEESIKVPFIMSQPGTIPHDINNSDLVSQYDFMPTLLDYLNIENPQKESLPGKSFASVLKGDAPHQSHEHVVVYDEYGPVRMIRTKDWKYIHRFTEGPNELFNLKDDIEEKNNLINKPEYQNKKIEMQKQLSAWFKKYIDPDKDGSKAPVTGSGQLGLSSLKNNFKNTYSQKRAKHFKKNNPQEREPN